VERACYIKDMGVEMNRYVTCCGLYCGACVSIFLQEKAEGNASLEKFSWEYEEELCPGCAAGENNHCEITACCIEHNVQICAFCPEFPCSVIRDFSRDEWPHHKEVLENLQRIKEVGIDQWLSEQKDKWSCPACQARNHWYQNKCYNCGAEWEARYKLD